MFTILLALGQFLLFTVIVVFVIVRIVRKAQRKAPSPTSFVVQRVTPHRAGQVVLAFVVIFLLSGLASWLFYIRPTVTALEQATPFQYGHTTSVALRGNRWYGIWTDYPNIMSWGVNCQVVATDGQPTSVAPSMLPKRSVVPDARPVTASVLWAVGQDATAWDSVLWWAAPETPSHRGFVWRQGWRLRVNVDGIYEISCAKHANAGGTTYDGSYFSVGRDVSSHMSTFDAFSGWAGPIGFLLCVIGIPTILLFWPFLHIMVKRRLREQYAASSTQTSSGIYSPFDATNRTSSFDADVLERASARAGNTNRMRIVNPAAASSMPASKVTIEQSYTINGQPVREFTQQTADLIGPILLDVGTNPAEVMKVMHEMGRMSLLAAKACLDAAPCPLPTTLLGPLGMDAAQLDALIAALRHAGARILVPAPGSVAARIRDSMSDAMTKE